MPTPLQAVKGMNDILPPDSARWEWFEDAVRRVMRRYGYANVRTPIVEPTPLFIRGLGEVTDIVEREMYSFIDAMNGDALTLRPEATAGVVRAAIANSLLREGGRRLYYIGAMFRHEKPQRGRSRQFHQVGVEALGHPGPDVDVEVILMARAILREVGLADIRLELNSLGQPPERKAHRAALIAHFEAHADQLDADSKRRLHTNPLRILDSKNEAMQPLIDRAPKLIDSLGEASLAHFDAVCKCLDAVGQPYKVNPRIVRGLDYYNLTVFEWITDKLGAQGTLCGGGRYDGLVEQLGGKPAPAVGWGMGMERVIEVTRELGIAPPPVRPQVYAIVPPGTPPQAVIACVEALREAGVSVLLNAAGAEGPGSIKAQFRRADASGAQHALIFGADELARGEVSIKPLRSDEKLGHAEQRTRALAAVAQWAAELHSA
jgi:histidyl-tRNA synthetase